MNKFIVIIGAGFEQIPAYKIAKKMGLKIIGTDMDKNAPAFEYADFCLICSTRNAKETLEKVLEFNKINQINGVFTIANDVPFTVATIAEKLGLPGISSKVAKIASNKILMKKKFIKNNVATPKFFIVENKNEFHKIIQSNTFPLILKPSDGRGSRGVLLLQNKTDLEWAWKHAMDNSDNMQLLVEEFVPGAQFSVEGIFLDGKYHNVGIAYRNYDKILETSPHIIENGGQMPAKIDQELEKEITKLISNGANALGINWGTIKSDIVLGSKGPMIIEIAARLSGNNLATHDIPTTTGVDLVSAMIKLSLNLKVDEKNIKPKFLCSVASRYFFPKPGQIKKINGVNKIKKLDFVTQCEIYKKQGDIQTKITSHKDRAGVIRCKGESYEDVIKKIESCMKSIEFIIE